MKKERTAQEWMAAAESGPSDHAIRCDGFYYCEDSYPWGPVEVARRMTKRTAELIVEHWSDRKAVISGKEGARAEVVPV